MRSLIRHRPRGFAAAMAISITAAVAAILSFASSVSSTTSVSPDNGPTAGGTSVEFEGLHFIDVAGARGTGTHSLGLTTDGTVYSWGGGTSGQLGNGLTSNSPVPTQVLAPDGVAGQGPYLQNVVSIAAGASHSLAVTSDGSVYAWGSNATGQIGVGNFLTSSYSKPVQVVSSGAGYLGGIKSVVANSNTSVALSLEGDVFTWGDGTAGVLGNGANDIDTPTPGKVVGGESGSSYLSGISNVASGDFHTLALSNSGQVYAWGQGTLGKLGNDNTVNKLAPVKVVGGVTGSTYLQNIVSVAAGSEHSLAVDSSGKAYSWGRNDNGQLGNGVTYSSSVATKTPIQVVDVDGQGFLPDIAKIAAGYTQSIALTSTGKVFTWGTNTGTSTPWVSSKPVAIDSLSGTPETRVTAIAASYLFSLAVTANGVYGWGSTNGVGQIGNGTTVQSRVPVLGSNLVTSAVTFNGVAGSAISRSVHTISVTTPSSTNEGTFAVLATADVLGGTSAGSPSTATYSVGSFTYINPLPPGTPGKPTAIAADSQATVTVVAPSDGGTPTSYTVTSSPESKTCTVTGSSGSCVVTGLANGTSYTFSSTAANDAGTSSSSVASEAVVPLAPARTPLFDSPVKTADGFTVSVTNYDASWSWTPSVSAGSVSAGTASGSTLPLTVTGLTANQSATITMQSTRSGYEAGSATVTGSALLAARTPVFDTPVKTADGFTVNVTNYDASWSWSPSVSAGSVSAGAATGSSLPLTVTGLSAAESAIVTVESSRSGYAEGTQTLTASSLSAARTPAFSSPVRTADGYTVNVTNYDASWSWSPSVSAGSVSAGTASGSTLPLTVTGLTANQSATITMQSTRSGYVTGSGTVSGSALSSARTPVFDTPVKTADGFTVNVTNYDASWSWSPSVSAGSVSTGTASGSTLPLTVTGLTANQSATITMQSTRSGYEAGSATVSGSSLQAARTPVFDTPVKTADGFTVNVTNYDASWSWSPSVSAGSVSAGTATGSSLPLTVTGLTAGQSATLTINTVRTGYANGVATLTYSALPLPPAVPSAPTITVGDGEAVVNVTRPSSGGDPETYTVTASPGGATCTITAPATSCTITGLNNGTSYTFTVTATNESGTSSSSAQSESVTPEPSNSAGPAQLTPQLNARIGQEISGSSVTIAGEGVKPATEWNLTMYSTPRLISSGVANSSGIFASSAVMPAVSESGWHRLVLSATSPDGSAATATTWVNISENGTILATAYSEAEYLAMTGASIAQPLSLAISALVLLIVGIALLPKRRKRGQHSL